MNLLFSEEALNQLKKFFNLPSEYSVFRQNNRGVWLREKTNEGRDRAYLYQTPFYSEGFWSLVLMMRGGAATGAAVLQSDNKVDVQGVIQRSQQYGI